MSTLIYCSVCGQEIEPQPRGLTLRFSSTAVAFRDTIAATWEARAAISLWSGDFEDRGADICRACLFTALREALTQEEMGGSKKENVPNQRDIVGSVIVPAKHYWPHDEGDAHYGQRRRYVVRDVFMHPWQGRGPVPDVDLFTVGAGLTLQALLP